MRSKNLILLLCLLCIVLVVLTIFLSVSTADADTYATVSSMPCSEKPNIPIVTGEDALCYALYAENSVENLRAAQEQAKYPEWKVRTQQEGNLWRVHIQSGGPIIPVYVCDFTFTFDGEFVTPGQFCGYIK